MIVTEAPPDGEAGAAPDQQQATAPGTAAPGSTRKGVDGGAAARSGDAAAPRDAAAAAAAGGTRKGKAFQWREPDDAECIVEEPPEPMAVEGEDGRPDGGQHAQQPFDGGGGGWGGAPCVTVIGESPYVSPRRTGAAAGAAAAPAGPAAAAAPAGEEEAGGAGASAHAGATSEGSPEPGDGGLWDERLAAGPPKRQLSAGPEGNLQKNEGHTAKRTAGAGGGADGQVRGRWGQGLYPAACVPVHAPVGAASGGGAGHHAKD
jgi:hypothetical protein